MASFNSVAVIGGGAYGTALACAAVRAGRDVVLYARNAEGAAQMRATRKNPKLPGVSLDQSIDITADIACRGARGHHPACDACAKFARGRDDAGAVPEA